MAYITAEELERLRSTPTSDRAKKNTARIAQGVTLVGGGVVAGLSYEVAARPFDNARKLVYLYDQHQRQDNRNGTNGEPTSTASKTARKALEAKSRVKIITRLILDKIRSDGVESFFVDPQKVLHATDPSVSSTSRSLQALLRTLGRVGPWGVGFLLYESLGGQLAQV